MNYNFGRKIPRDWAHVERYPFSRLGLDPATHVEKVLDLSDEYWIYYDQSPHNSCCGYSASIAMSILNRKLYNAMWLYHRACDIDGDPATTPEADVGTYLVAPFRVLEKRGHRPKNRILPYWYEGIYSYYWAQTVDEIRKAILVNRPVVFGVNWYTNFMMPQVYNNELWIGRGEYGYAMGGHAICCYGASDKREAFRLCNSWGKDYPLVWIGYEAVGRLLGEHSEVCVPLDIKSRKKR